MLKDLDILHPRGKISNTSALRMRILWNLIHQINRRRQVNVSNHCSKWIHRVSTGKFTNIYQIMMIKEEVTGEINYYSFV